MSLSLLYKHVTLHTIRHLFATHHQKIKILWMMLLVTLNKKVYIHTQYIFVCISVNEEINTIELLTTLGNMLKNDIYNLHTYLLTIRT